MFYQPTDVVGSSINFLLEATLRILLLCLKIHDFGHCNQSQKSTASCMLYIMTKEEGVGRTVLKFSSTISD